MYKIQLSLINRRKKLNLDISEIITKLRSVLSEPKKIFSIRGELFHLNIFFESFTQTPVHYQI